MELKALSTEVYQIQKHFDQVAPEGMTFKREADWALQIIKGSDLLQRCTVDSIRKSVYSVALTGLTLNPALALAYLVPMGTVCTLFISYKGLTKIVTDMGGR